MKTKDNWLLLLVAGCILFAIIGAIFHNWDQFLIWSFAAVIELYCWLGIQFSYYMHTKTVAKINKDYEETIRQLIADGTIRKQ